MKNILLTMLPVLLVSPLTSIASETNPFVNTHSLQIVSQNDLQLELMYPKELKQEILNFHEEMAKKGYHETNNRYAEFLLNLNNNAQDEIRSYRGTQETSDSHLKKTYKEIKLAFEFKKPPIDDKNIVGYAPSGSYIKTPKEGWNGLGFFFNDKNLGICSYNFTDLNLSNGSVTLPKEYTKYLVNNKPTFISVEGNDNNGFVYTVTWYNSLKVSTLDCATIHYQKDMSNKVLAFAKVIDSH